MSGLEQLVKMGILNPDFLKLEDVKVQTQSDVNLQSQTSADNATIVATATPPQSDGMNVKYMNRPDTLTTYPLTDLVYYQTVLYHWLYSSPSYGWWHFSKEDNEHLENMYRSGQKSTILEVGNNTFTINFEHMLQKGVGKPRHLLRSPTLGDIVLKGVAGSKITKRDIAINTLDQSHFGDQ